MCRSILCKMTVVIALCLGAVTAPAALGWYGYGGYYGVPSTPYGYATAYGYIYPGVPYTNAYGPPYYQGYGPPYVGQRGYTVPYYNTFSQPHYYDGGMYW